MMIMLEKTTDGPLWGQFPRVTGTYSLQFTVLSCLYSCQICDEWVRQQGYPTRNQPELWEKVHMANGHEQPRGSY